MRSTSLGLACLVSLVTALGCAQGGGIPGAGGAGGAGGGSTSSTTGTTSTSTTITSSTSTSSTSTMSTSTTSMTTTTSTSTTTPNGCLFQQHKCNGVCTDNTPESGCFTSTTCDPCPMPAANGVAICSSLGACDLQCDTGYQPNASKTACDAIPPPPECCDDTDCVPPAFPICLNGYCQFPFGAVCDPARCNEFCQCAVNGGTPQSTGQCMPNIVTTCECSL